MRGKSFMIIYIIILLFFFSLVYATEINKQRNTKSPSGKHPPSQVRQTQRTKQLPDLIVEKVWLDEQGTIVFSIKNAGRGVIPDSAHGQSRVRVRYGDKALDFRLTKVKPTGRPAVDGEGVLKKPGGSITYNTGIKLSSPAKVIVIVDYNKRIKESNEKNNQSKATTLKTVKKVAPKLVRKPVEKKVEPTKKPVAKPKPVTKPAPEPVRKPVEKKVEPTKKPVARPTPTPQQAQKPIPKPEQAKVPEAERQVQVEQPPKLNIPDLIVTDFNVNQGSEQDVDDNKVSFTFSAVVKNNGEADVNNTFYLTIEKYDETFNKWGLTGLSISRNCFPITAPLQVQQSKTISSRLYFSNHEISEQTVRLRAFVDSACNEELPPTWNHVQELREDNNFSNEASVTGGYYPQITGINPNMCIKGVDEVRISGYGLATQAGHTVKLRSGSFQTTPTISNWGIGGVFFTVPASVDPKKYRVSIADSNTLLRFSNEVELTVLERITCPWSDFITSWEDWVQNSMSIRIHTLKPGQKCTFQNDSTIKIKNPITGQWEITPIDLQVIQWHQAWKGDYRYNIKDMESIPREITLSRLDSWENQLQMEIPFESSGTEAKGCFKNNVGGGWWDDWAPDIHIDDAKMKIFFNFSYENEMLDYYVSTSFSADIEAAKSIADWFLNLFLDNWNAEVRDRVSNKVKKALGSDVVKEDILNNFMQLILFNIFGVNIPENMKVTNIEFDQAGIHLTYYCTTN